MDYTSQEMYLDSLKMKPRRPLLVLLIIFLLLSGLPTSPVAAQAAVTLKVDPALTSIQVGTPVTINISVFNGSNINAFDLTVVYDPSILKLESWSFGSYLSNLTVVNEQDDPGSFNLAATQLARAGVSGDGTLIKLVFRAVSHGSSTVALQDAVLATNAGDLITANIIPGKIISLMGALPTATASHTQTPPLTPAVTGTIRPTATMKATSSTVSSAQIPPSTNLGSTNTTGTDTNLTLQGGSLVPTLIAQTETLVPATITALEVPAVTSTLAPHEIRTIENENKITSQTEPKGSDAGKTLNSWLWGIAILLMAIFIIVVLLGINKKKRK